MLAIRRPRSRCLKFWRYWKFDAVRNTLPFLEACSFLDFASVILKTLKEMPKSRRYILLTLCRPEEEDNYFDSPPEIEPTKALSPLVSQERSSLKCEHPDCLSREPFAQKSAFRYVYLVFVSGGPLTPNAA